jgi:hypothetical protein
MEMSQGNSLYSYLKQTKISVFYFYFFTKIKNRRKKQFLSGGGLVPVAGEDVGKGCGRMNLMKILCTHVCKWQNETC